MSRPVAKRREKQKVGTISADNDAAIGEMVDDAMENVGGEGVITVEERVRRCLTPILTSMIN
jgi:chaperonin GroEL